MGAALKPILLPDRYQDLQPVFDGLQREILAVMDALTVEDGYVSLNVTLGDYANDAAAAAGGVPVGNLYRNGSAVMVRIA
jgi:hypothetical protein